MYIIRLSLLGAILGNLLVGAAAQTDLPSVTHSGYLSTNKSDNSELFYAYYEAEKDAAPGTSAPVLLWLQGGPGCASMFGNLYELGPSWVNESLQLVPNPGAWNRRFGLLFIDQPVGSGFSIAGSSGIPTDEMQIATDLYAGLQNFFALHTELQARPLFITGESYAGKYVPAIGHYILQLEQAHRPDHSQPKLMEVQHIPNEMLQLGPPLFKLAGLAIGNGLTDPKLQVLTHADTCHYMSLIDQHQKIHAMEIQLQVAHMIHQGQWKEASRQRELLLAYLQKESGVGTMLDTRRTRDYDADGSVDQYLNIKEVQVIYDVLCPNICIDDHREGSLSLPVSDCNILPSQEALNVKPNTTFVSCSAEVGSVLGPDVMKTVKPLIPDLLAALPVLLYQGQFDAQDGPGSVEAWTTDVEWPGRKEFFSAKRHIWRLGQDSGKFLEFTDFESEALPIAEPVRSQLADGVQPLMLQDAAGAKASSRDLQPVAGYWKHHKSLTSVVLKDAGHMVPRDQPIVTQIMIETWVQHCLDRTQMVTTKHTGMV